MKTIDNFIFEKLVLNKQSKLLDDDLNDWIKTAFDMLSGQSDSIDRLITAMKKSFVGAPKSSCAYQIKDEEMIDFKIQFENDLCVREANCAYQDLLKKFLKFIRNDVNPYIEDVEIFGIVKRTFYESRLRLKRAHTKESAILITMKYATCSDTLMLFVGSQNLVDSIEKILTDNYKVQKCENPEEIISIKQIENFMK